MLNHSEFMGKIRTVFPNTDAMLLTKVASLASPGVAPEGLGSTEVNAIVDSIYKLAPVSTSVVPNQIKSKFVLGSVSSGRLLTLKLELRKVVELAITISQVDFLVMQTTRSPTEQAAAVASGNSRTMHSKHLIQPDGFAWACDLGYYVNGKIDWTFSKYAFIALAMDTASTLLKCANHVRWGCAWDRVLSDFGGRAEDYLAEAEAYARRHQGSDLIDAPHFEWVP